MDHGNGPHQNENNQNRILFRCLLFIYWNWLHRLLVATFEHADLNSNWSHFFLVEWIIFEIKKNVCVFSVVGKLFIQLIKIHHMVYWYKFMGSSHMLRLQRVHCTVCKAIFHDVIHQNDAFAMTMHFFLSSFVCFNLIFNVSPIYHL